MNLHNETTQAVFNAYEYERGLGQSNPVWEPVPEYYYPLNWKQIIFYTLYVVGLIGASLGIMIGFLFWATQNTQKYILTWTVVLCAFIVISLVLLWVGGKDRRRQQKELIAQTNRKQEEMMRGKK